MHFQPSLPPCTTSPPPPPPSMRQGRCEGHRREGLSPQWGCCPRAPPSTAPLPAVPILPPPSTFPRPGRIYSPQEEKGGRSRGRDMAVPHVTPPGLKPSESPRAVGDPPGPQLLLSHAALGSPGLCPATGGHRLPPGAGEERSPQPTGLREPPRTPQIRPRFACPKQPPGEALPSLAPLTEELGTEAPLPGAGGTGGGTRGSLPTRTPTKASPAAGAATGRGGEGGWMGSAPPAAPG